MTWCKKIHSLKGYAYDSQGNLAIVFALSLFVLISGLTVAIDSSRMVALRSNLQDIADNAALAAAKSKFDEALSPKSVAETIIEKASVNFRQDVALKEPGVTINEANGEATVELSAELNTIGLPR